MNIAEIVGRASIILMASSSGIAMQAVASASAIMALGAITVALNVEVGAGYPVLGLIV